jgi:DMSO/TMAO reductase YedYZ molybdopterin-dependent catalytic subunit
LIIIKITRDRTFHFIILLLILLFITLLLSNNFFKEDFEIEGSEISSYYGEELSSIYDFRENSIKGYQYISKDDYELKITGLINKPQNFSYDEIINSFTSYKKVITLYCVEGWEVKLLWEGILVKDLLETVNISEKAKIIIFHAVDGFTTSFLIDYIIDNNIMLTYKMNNITMPPERGFPFQLAAEGKWGYKWIKWVTEIELSDNIYYRGFWESRGYSNDGDLNKSYLE